MAYVAAVLCWNAAWLSLAAPRAEEAPEGKNIVWRLSGPGGGGWIQSIAGDPHNADVLYVGCDVGGFYISFDAGRHYELRNTGLHDYFLESIAVHPRDSRIILLGTESGIHRTTDQGRIWTWIRAGFPPRMEHNFSAPIGAVCFDPLEPRVVFAGIGRPRWRKAGAGAIYRSDDTGETWRLISAGQLPAEALVSDLEFQPGQNRTLLAATSAGVYRSDDGGARWQASSVGLPHLEVEEVAFAPSAPQTVYLSLQTTARDKEPFNGGVYRSDDAGRTWREVNGKGMPRQIGRRGQPHQMTSSLKQLVVDPRDADVVYAGDCAWVTAGVYRTADGGKNWIRTTIRTKESSNMDYGWITAWGPSVMCLAISPTQPNRLVFGTSGQIYLTDDAGKSWQQRYTQQFDDGRFASTGLEVTCVHKIVPDPCQADRLWYCYADIGLLRSDDGGATFRRSFTGMKYPGNSFDLVVDPQRPKTIWTTTGMWGTNEGDVCRSDDEGQSWQVVGHPESGLPAGQTRCLALDLSSPVDQRRLLVTSKGNGLYESRDGGRTWQSVNGNLPAARQEPRGLWLDPRDGKRIRVALAGKGGAGVWETADAGRTWRCLHEHTPFSEIFDLAVDPRDAQTLYVAARRVYDHTARKLMPGGLFVSHDGGRAWQMLLDYRFVHNVVVNPRDSQVLYAATTDHPFHDDYPGQGLLVSRDGGRTWLRENSGLTNHNVHAIAINPHDPTRLYLGTGGNSVFIGRDSAPSAGAVK